MARQVIPRDKLGVLTKIAQGGQGVVYQAPNVKTKFAASMVYKEYKTQILGTIDFSAVAAMPALVEDSLSYAEAERLISVAAWPCALVEHAGTSTGFVMPTIPAEFFIPLITVKGVSTVTAEFQHLLNHPSVLQARGINIIDTQRYTLLREVAAGLAFLHKHGVCVGDISPKNLLFSLSPRLAVYFIDCDAMRIDGVSALPQLETPGWDAPPGEELATTYTDTYKLGLLALRLLVGDHDTTNPQHLPSNTPNLLRQTITDTLAKQPHSRPSPEVWTYVLSNAIEVARHQSETAAANNPTNMVSEPPPVPVVHSRPATGTPPSRPPVPPSRPPVPPSQPPPPPPPPPTWTPPPTAPASSASKLGAVFAVITIAVVAVIVGVILINALGNKHNSASTTQVTSYVQPSTSPSPPTPESSPATEPSSASPITPAPTTFAPPPPPPNRYIAIASAQPDGWGWDISDVSYADAEAKAMAKCGAVNANCHYNAEIANGCVAIAKGNDGTIWGGSGSTRAAAEQDSLNRSGGGRVLATACT